MIDREDRASGAVVSFVAETVALGPLRRDLLPDYLRWINDLEAAQGIGVVMPTTLESEQEWYDRLSGSKRDALFTLYLREGLRPIGTAGLTGIDHLHRTAEFGIFIGEKDCWNRGLGVEVARTLLQYGFERLDLHCIHLRVAQWNARAIRAYEKAGFRHAGRLRESIRDRGKSFDMLLMDCLASEFLGTEPP